MTRLLIIRPIHPLPGRHEEAMRWLADTEPVRHQAGQVSQFVIRSVVDSRSFAFVQIWEDRSAYERWRETAGRARLNEERQRYLTHDAAHLYEVIA